MPIKPYYDDEGITLYCGDCREVLPQIDCEATTLITDPPFGIVNKFGAMVQRGGTRRLEFPWDNANTGNMVADGLAAAIERCAPKASLFVFTGIDIIGQLLTIARRAKFTVKPAAWVKTCPPPAWSVNWWPSAFELAFYGYRNSPWFGDTDPKRRNVWMYSSYRPGQRGTVDHPTQKPLTLMNHLVRSLAEPRKGVVLDPFAGSGSTLVAAKLCGVRAIGVEIEERYCEIAARRLAQQVIPFTEE